MNVKTKIFGFPFNTVHVTFAVGEMRAALLALPTARVISGGSDCEDAEDEVIGVQTLFLDEVEATIAGECEDMEARAGEHAWSAQFN